MYGAQWPCGHAPQELRAPVWRGRGGRGRGCGGGGEHFTGAVGPPPGGRHDRPPPVSAVVSTSFGDGDLKAGIGSVYRCTM